MAASLASSDWTYPFGGPRLPAGASKVHAWPEAKHSGQLPSSPSAPAHRTFLRRHASPVGSQATRSLASTCAGRQAGAEWDRGRLAGSVDPGRLGGLVSVGKRGRGRGRGWGQLRWIPGGGHGGLRWEGKCCVLKVGDWLGQRDEMSGAAVVEVNLFPT